jgi:hypothetical protein
MIRLTPAEWERQKAIEFFKGCGLIALVVLVVLVTSSEMPW